MVVGGMANRFDLSGKVALVTGGNRGIGFAMADALAEAGADLVIWGSNPKRNEFATEQLRVHGRRVSATTVDVADEQAVTRAFATAIDQMGRIDAVFANAGIGGAPTPFVNSTGEELRRILDVNTAGTYYTLREACRHIASRAERGDPGGSLVLLGTVGTESGMSKYQGYAASKGALAPLMRAIVSEHSRHGIRVNLIQPGFIETEMTDNFRASETISNAIVQSIPQRRWGKAKDFAGIAVYLASEASAYHSGNVIVIDGGYLAH
jgi:NAD(P)-dependent dehydrogenase (short-subunit alcohol dehydrogenase family)